MPAPLFYFLSRDFFSCLDVIPKWMKKIGNVKSGLFSTILFARHQFRFQKVAIFRGNGSLHTTFLILQLHVLYLLVQLMFGLF